MPTIEIDDDVYRDLMAQCTEGDTINDVIKRAVILAMVAKKLNQEILDAIVKQQKKLDEEMPGCKK